VLELLAACQSLDQLRVRPLLHPDVTVLVDRGVAVGAPDAAESTVHGVDPAARRLVRLFADAPHAFAFEHPVNGRTGLVITEAGRVIGVLSAEVGERSISHVWIVLNPDKLQGWNVSSGG
jgi:hypothetical protein